jgi:hypothetical protein
MADKPLIIKAPRQGIAQSPHVGFGDIRNIDIYSIAGVARLNNILVKESSTTVDAQIKWIVKNPASPANLYAIDSNGSVYNSTDSGDTWAELSDREGAGQGLAVWKDYLFVAEGDKIDVYGPLSGSPTWDDDWASFSGNDGAWQPMLVSKLDGHLYIGDGRYVAKLEENSGQNFDPDTSSTYTFTASALTLPEDYRVKCLAEQNNYLMIGTWMGTNIYDNKIADIFKWDGSSTTYENPVILNENGIHAMVNINSYVYILAGIEGKVYKSNGTQAWQIAQVPVSIANILGGKYLEFYPGAIIQYKGRLFFGVSSQSTDGMGVYSLLETSQGNILNMEHFISTETTGGTNPVIIGALLGITRDQLVVGWRDNATYGIDRTNTASYAYTTNYSGFFESPLYIVGEHVISRKFNELEFYLAKELAASEGIRIKFRVNLTDTWTTLGTYTTTDIGTGKTSYHEENINIPETNKLQIRIELLGTSTTTPEFKQLTLK